MKIDHYMDVSDNINNEPKRHSSIGTDLYTSQIIPKQITRSTRLSALRAKDVLRWAAEVIFLYLVC